MTSRSYWTAVWCGFLVLTIGLGVRQSFGIFLKPVSAELHVGRELFSFGTALSMLLMGFFAPFSGRLCDRFGSAITIAGGGVVYVAGMVVTALMHGPVMLILGNVLVGVGLSAATFGPVLGVILRVAPPEKVALRSASARPAARSASSSSCRSPRCCRAISATGGRPCGP